MSIDVEQIIARLESYNAGRGAQDRLPVSDERVRAQRFTFNPSYWRRRWPVDVQAMPPIVAAAADRVSVSRQDLFDRAVGVSSQGDALEAYVWMCGWGAGAKARPVSRCLKPLSDPGAAAKLVAACQALPNEGPVAVYRRMSRGGDLNIRFLGPAFFTKWLYFNDYNQALSQERQAPLILDRWVAASVGWGAWGWTSAQYGEYLETVEQIRARLATRATLHALEHALFTVRA